MRWLHLISCGLLFACPATAPAGAHTWPTGNIRIIVAYAPGGTGDIVARLMADRLGPTLGQNVVVENRPGATGAIGTQMVVAAAPDGHTLLLGQTGEITINQHWMKGLSYDPVRDLQPVALASVMPLASWCP
jgi:tripartite-type tricarboxylate transporter receptor subunit TctC